MTLDYLTIILSIGIASVSIAWIVKSRKYSENQHIIHKLRNRLLSAETDNEALVVLRRRNADLVVRIYQVKEQMHENATRAAFEKMELHNKFDIEIKKLKEKNFSIDMG